MDSEDLVTICTVNHATEAEIIRSALESAGIACQIGGESQAGLAGVLEIDVLTHSSDAEAALKYLRTLKHITKLERRKAHDEREAKRHDEHEHAIQEPLPGSEIQPPAP